MIAVQQPPPFTTVDGLQSDLPAALPIAYYLPDGRAVHIAPAPTWDATSQRIIGTVPHRWVYRLGCQKAGA